MALDDTSSEGMRCSEGQLTQNSDITVTIDDLTDGLIVVSFAHSENLYQGVLFQLNRERGIPSGISFAKDHAVGAALQEKNESDPSQMTSLHQRHTYNSNQGTTYNGASHSPISQPSLRRIIKPPARFQNARMSLRLRARPVLCAKCRSLCDDKTDSINGKDEPLKDETTTDKNKKDRHKLGSKGDSIGTSTASSSSSATEQNGKLRGGNELLQGCSAVDPKDLCYESMGSTRVVENYWKRPLVQPLIPSSEETYARLRKHRAPSDSGREHRKKVKSTGSSATAVSDNDVGTAPVVPPDKRVRQNSGNDNVEFVALPPPATNSIFVTKSNVCDSNFPNTRSRKALNLKMCITKITEMRDEEHDSSKGDRGKDDKAVATTSQRKDDFVITNSHLPSPVNHHSDSSMDTTEGGDNHGFALHNDKTSSDEGSSSGGLKTRGSSKRSKAWENRIRTKSTVPVRFRDESYLTKNIFNFNKRRPLGSTEGGGDIPVLTISKSDDENTYKVSTLLDPESVDSTVSTSKIDDNCEDPDEEITVSSIQSSASSHEHSSPENGDDDEESHQSLCSSSNINEVPANLSIKCNTPKGAELIKTPTIKITFGPSGNGTVVQIPPKITQHLESPSTTNLKAVRKAMKKAKKEAKRRRSVSPDFSPSASAFSPDQPLKAERSNPTSPVTPSLNEPSGEVSSDVSHNNDDKSQFLDYNSSEPSTSTRVPKKKKKQKKRRRNSKVLKENDSSSSSHEHVIANSIPSPQSTSSCNNDNSFSSHESPGEASVKSCSLADSVSNSTTCDSVPSMFKDGCPPRRRRSMPATSTTSHTTEAPRVCINLKRIDTNAYIPLPLHSLSSQSDNDDPSSQENNGVDTDESEINDFPVNNGNSHDDEAEDLETGQSVDSYKDKETECLYRIGDIVWGKLPSCPWWPGKIDDILTVNDEETRAKVSWYKSTTQSCMRFKMLVPFTKYFDSKYTRSRRRGLYQLAVKDALIEAHRVNPEDLQND